MNLARQKSYFVIENGIFDKSAIFANLRTKSRIDFWVLVVGSFEISIWSISTVKYFSIFDLGYISYFTY